MYNSYCPEDKEDGILISDLFYNANFIIYNAKTTWAQYKVTIIT